MITRSSLSTLAISCGHGRHPHRARRHAILARMLGMHIDVAVTWQHASAGDWSNYAADVATRASNHGHAGTMGLIIDR